jgi:hypothetical protein
MMTMPGTGVQIRLAEGGYIVEWMERQKPKLDEGNYLEQERQAGPLQDCLHGPRFMGPRFKCAVRVKLEDALKLAGEVLSRLHEVGVEGDELGAGEAFISGA